MSSPDSNDKYPVALSAHEDRAFIFTCEGCRLVAILHSGSTGARQGILFVVGGPQYRVGSHRQFRLLAGKLASNGYPVLRFDNRGMGDSEGDQRTFEDIEADIRAALDAFFSQSPGLENVVIFGLCDAASAALLYAHADHRVCGLILVNPWVRSEQSEARTYLRHYYVARLLSHSFWSKLFWGSFDWRASMKSWFGLVKRATRNATERVQTHERALEARMREGLEQFSGRVLIALSGADLTAAEFEDTVAASDRWQRLLKVARVSILKVPHADHTLSKRVWRERLDAGILSWLENCD